MILIIVYILGFFAALLILILIVYFFIIYPVRTKRFRKNVQIYDRCRFYVDETKHAGRIIRLIPNGVVVEFINSYGRTCTRRVHKTQLYPSW